MSEFQANKMGVTPDGKWTWYVISMWPKGANLNSDAHILGIIVESPEIDYSWDSEKEPRRYYRLFFYEAGRYEGTIPMTSAKSIGDAVEYVVAEWEQHQERLRLHGGETR